MSWSESFVQAMGIFFGGSATTAVVVALTKFFLERKHQPIEHFAMLVGRLEARINTVEKEHKECMEEHSVSQRRIGQLEAELAAARDKIVTLEASVDSFKRASAAHTPNI